MLERWGWVAQVRRATEFIKPHWKTSLLILLLALLTAGLNAAEPLALMYVFDGLAGDRAMRAVAIGVGALAGVAVTRELVGALSNWLGWRTRLGLKYELLERTVGRLSLLPVAFHKRERVGGTITRLDRGISGFVSGLMEIVSNALPSVAYLIISVAIMFRMDWRLSLLVLGFAPLPALIGAWAAREQTRRERLLLEHWAAIYARLNEVLSGIMTVKSFTMEESEKRRFLRRVSAVNRAVIRGVGLDSGVGAAKNLAAALARVGALLLGGYLVVRGEITVGVLVAFLGYVGGLFGPVQGLTEIYQTLRRASVSLDVIFRILDAEDTVEDAPDAIEVEWVRGAVEFEDVGFGYEEDGRILEAIDIEARPGETVALVGSSGSGKTTLMALLQRLYDPTEGVVRVDGIDVRRFRQRSLRRHIGVVLQDSLLFNDTVRNNIAYGRPGAPLREIEAAARAANAHDFIQNLPNGYDTAVGERGSRLSMGERQRIAIARALIRDPAILILDEATASLDAESESLVQEALERLVVDRTTFIIAHRLATVVHADRILVLNEGRIVERGTHDALMAIDGHYASFVRLQLSGFESPYAA